MPNPQVDHYLLEGCGRCPLYQTPQCKVHTWQDVLVALRSIVLGSELTEEVKWGSPCYTLEGKNVLMVSAFKDYAFISFFKGVLMKDNKGLMHSPGANSQAVKQLRYTDASKVISDSNTISDYIREAVQLERSGAQVPFSKSKDLEHPQELIDRFDEDPVFKAAFEALTPGRQRGYNIFFSSAKKPETRIARIEKLTPKIMEGKGYQE